MFLHFKHNQYNSTISSIGLSLTIPSTCTKKILFYFNRQNNSNRLYSQNEYHFRMIFSRAVRCSLFPGQVPSKLNSIFRTYLQIPFLQKVGQVVRLGCSVRMLVVRLLVLRLVQVVSPQVSLGCQVVGLDCRIIFEPKKPFFMIIFTSY